ncbi:ABC transporter permease subunit [soil metagenome]
MHDVQKRRPVPERFQVSKGTLRFDTFMTHAIRVGGVGIIVAVFGIFFFILGQVIPLFGGAKVKPARTIDVPGDVPKVLGIDEWAELPFVYDAGDTLTFTDLKNGGVTKTVPLDLGLAPGTTVSAINYDSGEQRVAIGTSDGHVGQFEIKYSPDYTGDERVITAEVIVGEFYEIGDSGAPILEVGYGATATDKLFCALQQGDAGVELHAITLTQKRSLIGAGKIVKDQDLDLTPLLSNPPARILVSQNARSVIVASTEGELDYLYDSGDGFALRQSFEPFADEENQTLSMLNYVFGDVSMVLTSGSGKQVIWSLYLPEGASERVWGLTKELPPLDGPATFYVASQRNKAFLTGSHSEARLAYATTGLVRWNDTLPFDVAAAAIDAKFENLALMGADGVLHLYDLHDPHPEAGARAFFGKLWYEGGTEPEYKWQSTGGTDDFELKISMVPLIFGSLKGTLYSLLFSIPIALLAAIYTAQFLNYKIKKVVKPTMEIMASLPSVVLGFLAALWLAPILETKVPSVILFAVGLPAIAVLVGWAWNKLPVEQRTLIPRGYEFVVFMPLLVIAGWGLWELGPVLERALFVVEVAPGKEVADFRLWWPEVTGTAFEQRNSMVVGFMMGFAVIPIIFTISEDALSNVPPSLTAASSALGASRWQVVRTVVLPIASAGIFSALMIGFGRAVGETMVMVMATGNTPLMEWNIFNGMRTLSANIAVELPEAPRHSTHYRTLFLGALILFILTFVLNTAAEILRSRLREKYKLV